MGSTFEGSVVIWHALALGSGSIHICHKEQRSPIQPAPAGRPGRSAGAQRQPTGEGVVRRGVGSVVDFYSNELVIL